MGLCDLPGLDLPPRHNERERTGQLVGYGLLPGIPLTDQGFPVTQTVKLPFGVDHLIGFNELLTCRHAEGAGVHCFLDDYQFERLWRSPQRYLTALAQYPLVVGPDFSLYTDFPEPLQRWNHYRNQLLTAWLQQQGLPVVPAASWAGPASFAWCFDGLPAGTAVAVSTVGCLVHRQAEAGFMAGAEELIRQVAPAEILVYGKVPDNFAALLRQHNTPWQTFPHGMAARMRARKETR